MLILFNAILACSPSSPPACDTGSWQTLITQHETRYPGLEIPDVYKLLHQATMGSEHAMPNAKMAEDWMKNEVANLGDGPTEPMIDTPEESADASTF